MALIVRMPDNPAMMPLSEATELRKLALEALLEPDSNKKVSFTQWIHEQAATIFIALEITHSEPHGVPGCPLRPELRSHLDVPKRSPFTTNGLAALLHAVTHIEFNAINLGKGTHTEELFNLRSVASRERLVAGCTRPRLANLCASFA